MNVIPCDNKLDELEVLGTLEGAGVVMGIVVLDSMASFVSIIIWVERSLNPDETVSRWGLFGVCCPVLISLREWRSERSDRNVMMRME